MILLSSLSGSYDILLSLLLKKNTTLTMDEVLTTLLETNNKKKLATSLSYEDCFATDSDWRESSNYERNKIYPSRDGNFFKPHPGCDIKCFYCHKKGNIKRYCKDKLKAIRDIDEKK